MTDREALEIAHRYGLTLRQFGSDIRACLADRRTNAHPRKSVERAFSDDMAQIAYESGCEGAEAAALFSQEVA